MKSVMQVVRNTSLFFQPQIRTKIMNEGWASYWHEILFLQDERIAGREIDFAKVNAGVTAMPRAGLNPYALGMRLFYFIESEADKGRLGFEYERLQNARRRDAYDRRTGTGKDMVFQVRERLSDFTFLSRFVNQDFVNQNNLFVVGKRLNPDKMVWEYYVKSRSARAYREMLFENLYHPPHIEIDLEKSRDGELYLVHHFEEKPLVTEYISNTLLGIEYLWGKPVHLETSEVVPPESEGRRLRFAPAMGILSEYKPDDTVVLWRRVLYTMEDRKLSKKAL
jgi:stage V sporulation protein R